ncbi:hypothetical protein [Maritimibacter dapengensis]|uniref:Uncharacterized protein n=1 Tax=Maritimibacter dapengensis TaxID=2836868 RepID=A0ABS6SWE3_9RHOB|nr:hypothetical protein [Maritimibacter dapengensis]MBV7377293.1 hypothetical protein [Maritimibacter dapengensis]
MEVTAAGIKRFLSRSLWLGTTNYYRGDVVSRLKRSQPSNPTQHRNLAQYIAASAPLHLNDGWSYLGRSISSLISGDAHRALHLAYYAELRAAMSLLASRGVGIFNRQHYAIISANQTKKLATKQGTHIMTWLVLEAWALAPQSGNLFTLLVRPEGSTLDDWFHSQGGASVLAPQAKAWFMQWGMDLNLAIEDREARNASSYRPDGVPSTWTLNIDDTLEFVKDLWFSLEPSASSSFDQIDRHILRLAVERLFKGRTGRNATAMDTDFLALVRALVSAQGLAGISADRIESFLLRQTSPQDPQIFLNSRTKPSGGQTDVFSVVSRAVLLLRVASGSTQQLLSSADLNKSLLKFWWEAIGEVRGLWQPGHCPDPLSDLWADVDESLREIDLMEATAPGSLASPQGILTSIPREVSVLSSHERVGLWGLCS